MRYYLGLGSNSGDRMKNLERAADLLMREGIRIMRASSVYKTEPLGILTESWFYNQVLEVKTRLGPKEILLRVQRIEEMMGRIREESVSSRTIDIDILLAGKKTWSDERLQIPHPRMTERNFVLRPLAEIAPKAKHPILNEKIEDLLKKSEDRSCVVKL